MQPPFKRLRLAVEAAPQQQARGLQDYCTPAGDSGISRTAVVGGTETVRRIQSVERVLCSQSLNTPEPSSHGACGWQGAAEDDFKISYSQTYTREDSKSKSKSAIKDDGAQCGVGQHLFADEGREFRSQQGQRPRNSLTPELAFEDHLSEQHADGSHATRKLFPIFRPLAQRKVLHIIRHGESEYNAATRLARDFRDPQIYNPKLTEKGRREALQLRDKLRFKVGKIDGALWVTSPLTRAIETFLLSCPLAGALNDDSRTHSTPKVVIRPELSEQLVTTGDIGLPVSRIEKMFPELAEAVGNLPERWWFAADLNCCLTQQFRKTEPKQSLKERVGKFRQWVVAQPEQVVIAYGHSVMIRELSGGKSLRNCELLTMHL